jgi:hypothetical protein
MMNVILMISVIFMINVIFLTHFIFLLIKIESSFSSVRTYMHVRKMGMGNETCSSVLFGLAISFSGVSLR